MDKIKELKRMIDEVNNIVVFTGAGASTASGIRDFRGKNGLYKQKSLYFKLVLSRSLVCSFSPPEKYKQFFALQ